MPRRAHVFGISSVASKLDSFACTTTRSYQLSQRTLRQHRNRSSRRNALLRLSIYLAVYPAHGQFNVILSIAFAGVRAPQP